MGPRSLPLASASIDHRSSVQSGAPPLAKHTRGGTRTRNLLLRREAPYPLGHTSSCKLLLRILRPLSSILCQFRALSRLLCKCSETGCPAVCQTTPVGFEPTRGDPIGLAGRRLNHSAKVSSGQDQRDPSCCFQGFPPCARPRLLLPQPPQIANTGSSPFQASDHDGRALAFLSSLGRLCVFDSTSFCVVSHVSDKECRGMPTLDLECLVLPVTCNA